MIETDSEQPPAVLYGHLSVPAVPNPAAPPEIETVKTPAERMEAAREGLQTVLATAETLTLPEQETFTGTVQSLLHDFYAARQDKLWQEEKPTAPPLPGEFMKKQVGKLYKELDKSSNDTVKKRKIDEYRHPFIKTALNLRVAYPEIAEAYHLWRQFKEQEMDIAKDAMEDLLAIYGRGLSEIRLAGKQASLRAQAQ